MLAKRPVFHLVSTMKIVPVLLASISLTSGLPGALKIPKGVFDMTQLEEAQAKAEEESKGLAFVMTDPGTT